MTTDWAIFDSCMQSPMVAQLGLIVKRKDIRSSAGPFQVLPEYRTSYPETVTRALGELYQECNHAFEALVRVNREWDSDYQCCVGASQEVVNHSVQIDMVGLPGDFLRVAAKLPVPVVREILRGRIFEIENSLAMYSLLEGAFATDQDSSFKVRFREHLNDLRTRFDRPIALLAVTDEKHRAMCQTEFGLPEGQIPSDAEVKKLSGFDCLLGPQELRQHVEASGGACRYLLYARTSDPVVKLRNPKAVVDHPLLGDAKMRRIIKANTLTINIDASDAERSHRINDTKSYMPTLGMGFPIDSLDELFSRRNDGTLQLTPRFGRFLTSLGVAIMDVESGASHLRGKPIQGAYGCYGHVRGATTNRDFRSELSRNLRQRGRYIIQPEMTLPTVTNSADGQNYYMIDRNFFAMTASHPRFLGGFRSLMPVSSEEARRGRNHGNQANVLGEIF